MRTRVPFIACGCMDRRQPGEHFVTSFRDISWFQHLCYFYHPLNLCMMLSHTPWETITPFWFHKLRISTFDFLVQVCIYFPRLNRYTLLERGTVSFIPRLTRHGGFVQRASERCRTLWNCDSPRHLRVCQTNESTVGAIFTYLIYLMDGAQRYI